jgi:hypothetical protein
VTGFTAVAVGTAAGADPAAFSRNSPSFFADPAAWAVTAAVADALARSAAEVRAAVDGRSGTAATATGVLVVSAQCTATTMRAIAGTAGRGLVSPLRFAGANPGVLAGLPCITWRLRGPSLVLGSDAETALPVAAVVVRSWFELGQAGYALVAVHSVVAAPAGEARHEVRCAVLRPTRPGEAGDELVALFAPAGQAGGR